MGLLRGLATGLLALAALLVAVAFVLPRELAVTRDTLVAAPPERVFARLDSLEQAAAWWPWLDGARPAFAGPKEGVGNRMTWKTAAGASASAEIITRVPGERVEAALELPGLGIATTWLVLKPEGAGTRLTWGLMADTGNWPTGRYRGLLLSGRLGAEIEGGLEKLKALAEAG